MGQPNNRRSTYPNGDVLGCCKCPIENKSHKRGVQAELGCKSGKKGVGHALRHNHKAYRDACDKISHEPRDIVVEYPSPEWEERLDIAANAVCGRNVIGHNLTRRRPILNVAARIVSDIAKSGLGLQFYADQLRQLATEGRRIGRHRVQGGGPVDGSIVAGATPLQAWVIADIQRWCTDADTTIYNINTAEVRCRD